MWLCLATVGAKTDHATSANNAASLTVTMTPVSALHVLLVGPPDLATNSMKLVTANTVTVADSRMETVKVKDNKTISVTSAPLAELAAVAVASASLSVTLEIVALVTIAASHTAMVL